MKKCMLLACLIPALLPRLDAAITAPNDIMILGVSGWTGQDNFTFVNFAPIGAGESISFTDGSWNGTNFNPESTYVFTNTTGFTIPIGTVTQAPANALTLSFLAPEQVFVYVGAPAAPTPIFGFQNTDWGSVGASELPPALVNNVSALDLTFTEAHAEYIGLRSFASIAAAKAAILAASNWSPGPADIIYNTSPIVVPEPMPLVLAALTGLSCLLVKGSRRLFRRRD